MEASTNFEPRSCFRLLFNKSNDIDAFQEGGVRLLVAGFVAGHDIEESRHAHIWREFSGLWSRPFQGADHC